VKVGDLVKIHKRCRSGGRMAIIIEMGWINDCTIVFMDTNEQITANLSNLEMISESR
jgi:hypothetical protein